MVKKLVALTLTWFRQCSPTNLCRQWKPM